MSDSEEEAGTNGETRGQMQQRHKREVKALKVTLFLPIVLDRASRWWGISLSVWGRWLLEHDEISWCGVQACQVTPSTGNYIWLFLDMETLLLPSDALIEPAIPIARASGVATG